MDRDQQLRWLLNNHYYFELRTPDDHVAPVELHVEHETGSPDWYRVLDQDGQKLGVFALWTRYKNCFELHAPGRKGSTPDAHSAILRLARMAYDGRVKPITRDDYEIATSRNT